MSTYSLPYPIQCAELAARRESVVVRQQLKGRVSDLALIFTTAPFIGFFGTVLGISNSFQSMGTSKLTAMATVASRLSEAMVPGGMGLLVALIAFWFYRHLGNRLEGFELEMESTTVDLANRLTVYLNGLKNTDPELWRVLSRRPAVRSVPVDTTKEIEPPRFRLDRMYPNALRELVWPQLRTDFERESILHAGSWLCLAYAVIGYLAYWASGRSASAVVIFSFFAAAAFAIRKSHVQGAIYVFAFFGAAAVCCLVAPYRAVISAQLWVLAPLPFLGSVRAARRRSPGAHSAYTVVLPLLFAGACSVMLFGTVFGLYRTQSNDSSMSPTIRPGDWLVGRALSPGESLYRGEIVEMTVGDPGTVRVVGLPADRVKIRAGQLIVNGVSIREPYTRPFVDPKGDFPLPRDKSDQDDALWIYGLFYPRVVEADGTCVIPGGMYLVLNDDRKQLGDSRTLGLVRREYMSARLILACSKGLPRLLH